MQDKLFQPLKKKKQIMAYTARVGQYYIVYGTRFLKRSDLRDVFPDYQFCFIKQVHGCQVIPAEKGKIKQADGHWTKQKNQALVVQTADCVPLFLMKGKWICAVHAGWRGVEKQIVYQALSCQLDLSFLEISMGPHILQKHFVVDKDVAQKLAQSSPHGKDKVQERKEGKYSVSLLELIQDQIFSKTSVKNSYLFIPDTFSSNLFHSLRKNAEKKVGQTNFIVRIQ